MQFTFWNSTVLGTLTKDVEVKSLPNGGHIYNFRAAINYNFKKASSDTYEKETTYLEMVCFNKLPDNIVSAAVKGATVTASGRCRMREYDDKNGVKQRVTELIIENIVATQAPRSAGGNNAPRESSPYRAPETAGSFTQSNDLPF